MSDKNKTDICIHCDTEWTDDFWCDERPSVCMNCCSCASGGTPCNYKSKDSELDEIYKEFGMQGLYEYQGSLLDANYFSKAEIVEQEIQRRKIENCPKSFSKIGLHKRVSYPEPSLQSASTARVSQYPPKADAINNKGESK